MSIEPCRDQFTPVCDGCETKLAGEMSFNDAVAAMRRAGWKTIKIKKTGRYVHYCRVCQGVEKLGTEESEEERWEQRLRAAAEAG